HHDHPSDEDAGHDHTHAHHHEAHGDGTAGYHPHESPLSMLIPLIVLSIGAVFAGIVFHHQFIYPEEGAAFWKGSLAFDEHLM
ncbi:NADH-quinone oxidoreductase subunit L, partial [Klebsiella pneumoniae]|nr:NADH-quinone oxidoreductase subunit L [Klebsiella pneumoniae]